MKFDICDYDKDENLENQKTGSCSANAFVLKKDSFFYGNWELCKVSKNSLEFMITDKNGYGFQMFSINGNQDEIETLLREFYWEKYISWTDVKILIPVKGLNVINKSSNKNYFITNINGSRTTICSPVGEILDIHFSELYKDYSKV